MIIFLKDFSKKQSKLELYHSCMWLLAGIRHRVILNLTKKINKILMFQIHLQNLKLALTQKATYMSKIY